MTTLIADTLLGEARPEIVRQWQAGELVRWGGVLRRRAGLAGGGQIVAHLRDVGRTDELISSPLAGLAGLTKVAAAASVLNLGVSVAGFAVMTYKLHHLQKSLALLTGVVQGQHRDVISRFDEVAAQLVEVRAVQMVHGTMLHEVHAQLALVRLEQSIAHLAKVRASLELLHEISETSAVRCDEAERGFREAAIYFELTIEQSPLRRERPLDWFDVLTRFRGWCIAHVAEVTLARRLGRNEHAAILASSRAKVARTWCDRWVSALLPRDSFGGVYRFSHRAFASMPREEFVRLVRMQEGQDPSGIDAVELAASHELTLAAPSLEDGWWMRELAVADMLDFCEEATARLESLAEELHYCNDSGFSWEDWESISLPSENRGLVLLMRDGSVG